MENIIGKNIEYYREKTKHSKKGLAEMLNVDPSLLTYYVQGKRMPTIGNLNKLAEVFSIPVEWLLMENPPRVQLATRAKGKETAAETKEMLRWQRMVIDFVDLLQKTGVPNYLYKGPSYHEREPNEEIADAVRRTLGLPEIFDYDTLKPLLQSQFNIYVFELPFSVVNISGITFFRNGVYCVFINKGHKKERRFFSLAHELAHVLFHLHDESYLISRVSAHDRMEQEANEFAAKFLVSERQVDRLVNPNKLHLLKKEYIQTLAETFHVSAEMIFYCLAKKGMVGFHWKSYRPQTDYQKAYDKKIVWKDLPWFYVLVSFLALKMEKITLEKFAELLLVDHREGSRIAAELDGKTRGRGDE